MSESGTQDTHPDLLKAQKAAKIIQDEGFDDLGGKTAEIRVNWIVNGLNSTDESEKEQALKDIKRFKNEWLLRDGAGTAGSILTRLMARGIIEDFPKPEDLDMSDE